MDIRFKFRGVPDTLGARVIYQSTLSQVCGELRDGRDYAGAMKRLIRAWRQRLAQLQDGGWRQIDSARYAYARNCRPAGVRMQPYRVRACRLRICPFCHGRQVEAIAGEIAAYRGRVGPITLAHYTRHYGDVGTSRIIVANEDDLHYHLAQSIEDHMKLRARIVRTANRHSIGGYSWIRIEPIMYVEPREERLGYWSITHTGVFVGPPSWRGFKTDGQLELHHRPDDEDLAEVVSAAFRYPKRWMTADERIVAEMLNGLNRRHTFSKFGVFHDGSNKVLPSSHRAEVASRNGHPDTDGLHGGPESSDARDVG